jgi:hypothetical protein
MTIAAVFLSTHAAATSATSADNTGSWRYLGGFGGNRIDSPSSSSAIPQRHNGGLHG